MSHEVTSFVVLVLLNAEIGRALRLEEAWSNYFLKISKSVRNQFRLTDRAVLYYVVMQYHLIVILRTSRLVINS